MDEGHSLGLSMIKLVLQLALIIIVAKSFGFIVSRYLKQPSVLGELLAGMIIGPYALGGIALPFFHGEALFVIPPLSSIPVSPELYGFAIVASIVLLFLSGLETDLKTFLRFAGVGSLVGLGGVISTFLLGSWSAVLFIPSVTSLMDQQALFLGIIATATSVGISARILSEKRKLSSPEGVTLLSAAVLDDVLGIILLTVVTGLASAGGGARAAQIPWDLVGRIALKAFGFWLLSTILAIVLAPRLTWLLKKWHHMETLAMISLGLALLLAGLSEMAGLAMIIGAYVTGLGFSQTDVVEDIRHKLEGLYSFIVPIFFCVMGMLVDFSVLPSVFFFGLFYSLLGIVGKIVGCGLPALMAGFNTRGALRIGAGMLPRGEVTLIMAGVGLSSAILDPGLFGVAVMSMLISSLIAPPVLALVFRGKSGFKKEIAEKGSSDLLSLSLVFPTQNLADFVLRHLIEAFRQAEFFPKRVGYEKPVYALMNNGIQITLLRDNLQVIANFQPDQESFVRLLFAEELLTLKDLFKNAQEVSSTSDMEREILGKLFDNRKE